jgi:hypothetical protein
MGRMHEQRYPEPAWAWRGSPAARRSRGWDASPWRSTAEVSPSPWGEGWGEGEWDACMSSVIPNQHGRAQIREDSFVRTIGSSPQRSEFSKLEVI